MRPMLLAFGLAAILVPAMAPADEAAPGTVWVASRLFLVSTDGGRFRSDESDERVNLLALGRWNWVQRLTENDPVLDGVLLKIQQRPSPAAYLLGPDRLHSLYPDRNRIPQKFRAEGYVSATMDGAVPSQFLFHPDVPGPDFYVSCATDYPLLPADRFLLCSILASYPLDPAITLESSLFFPPPFAELQPRFGPIVERMREIALCLDVTEQPPADPDEQLQMLLAENPTLTGCRDLPVP